MLQLPTFPDTVQWERIFFATKSNMDALVRTEAQRNKLKHALQNNEPLDARHNGFHMEGEKVFCTLPNGSEIELIMSAEAVQVQETLSQEFDKPENASKGISNLYWGLKNRFLGITRGMVEMFLKGSESYVLAQANRPRVNW
jgi:hypothetical protein